MQSNPHTNKQAVIRMNHEVTILQKQPLNHDVIQFRLQKPENYTFNAGQAIELSIPGNVPKGPGPFTFTALDTKPYLELIIKIYGERNGLTSALAQLNPGDNVMITDPWDSYINKGPGVFIAGGAGITPFIALLRKLNADNNIGESHLFFYNKTREDIFMEQALRDLLGKRYINILTRDGNESNKGLDKHFFKKHISNLNQPFYVCGPPDFMDVVRNVVTECGAKEEMVNVSF